MTTQTTAAGSKQVRDFLGIPYRHCFVIPLLIGLMFYLLLRLDLFIVIVFVPKCTRVNAMTLEALDDGFYFVLMPVLRTILLNIS